MEKIKIVLIDDEPLVFETICSLIDFDNGPFELVGTASNGQSGYSLCMKKHPDIAFIDIKMPIMDGLTLARYLKESGEKTEVVILTAYQDFAYARQGIAIGIYDYLPKHEINRKSLELLLDKLLIKVKNKKQSDYFSLQSLYSSIIYHTLPDSTFLPEGMESRKLFLAVVIGAVAHPLSLKKKDKSEELPLPKVSERIAEHFQLSSLANVEYRNGSQVYLFKNDTISQIHHLNQLHSVTKHIISMYQNIGGKNACMVMISAPVMLGDLHWAVKFTYQKLETEILTSMRPVSMICYAKQDLSAMEKVKKIDCASVFCFLRRNQFSDAKKYLANDFCKDLLSKELTRESVEQMLTDLTAEINFVRERKGLFPIQYEEIMPKNLYTLTQALEWIISLITQIEQECQAQPTAFSPKLEKAIEYIRANYKYDITQQQVADASGFSCIYLSVLFKRELNTTFLQYLTDYRIQAAKYLLEYTDKKVYEISSEVGYQTSQYFSKIFRQSTNMTPSQYREATVGKL